LVDGTMLFMGGMDALLGTLFAIAWLKTAKPSEG
jgi:hypothetical protein